MAYGAIAMAVVVVASLAYAYFAASKSPNMNEDDMSPANLDSFSITTASEGEVIPKVYSRVRVKGNILWYGNLKSVPEYDEVETGGKGGGGGGSQQVLQGYHYYLDVWQGVCCGPAELLKAYQDDKETNLGDICKEYIWNDGTQATFPTEPGEYASCLPGVAHIFLKEFYCGFNTSNVPTLHFVVNSVPQDVSFFGNAELPNGINPAAIVYDILRMAGARSDELDLDAFQTAADYWQSVGYGLNVSLTRKEKASRPIERVLGYVGGAMYESTAGTYALQAFDPDVSASEDIVDEQDCTELMLKRKTWEDTYNDFSGKYQSEDYSETMRVVVAQNPASINLMGRKASKSVDLSGFRDQASASRRLWEIMKRESYPSAEMQCSVFLSKAHIQVGQIVRVTSSRYGFENVEFRITTKDISEIDENTVKLQGEQVTERLYDSSFSAPSGAPAWVPPDNSPVAIDTSMRLVELPRNPLTGTTPAIMVLAARAGQEDGMTVYRSNDGTDYTKEQRILTWSQKGVLQADYPADTYKIDDTQGILYEPWREDPVFQSFSRTDLFGRPRFAICGNEIMGFQYVFLEGENDIRLKGIIRGMFHTPIEAHATGDVIWLTNIGDALFYPGDVTETWLKFVPTFGTQALDLDQVAAHNVTITGKAKRPWPPAGVKAVRSGSSITVSWMPCDVGNEGAGLGSPDNMTDQFPYEYDGDFLVNGSVVAGTETTITDSGEVTIEIKARQNGYLSDPKTITVPVDDGAYYIPED